MMRKTLTVLALACGMVMSGCQSSKVVTAPSAEVSQTREMLNEQGRPIARVTDTARSTGAGLNATGENVKDSTSIAAPRVRLPGGAAAGGGGLDSDTSLTGGSTGLYLLVAAGVLCVIGGGVCLYLGLGLKPSLICFGLGAGLIVSGIYPAVLLFLTVGGAVVVAGYLIWQHYGSLRTHEALRAVIAGVATAPPEAASVVKAAIAAQADAKDAVVIARVKAKDAL